MKRKRVGRDFIVTARIRELAKQNGWPSPDDERDAFVDYHLAKGSLFVDVEAAFRTWLRNAARWRKMDHTKEIAQQSQKGLQASENSCRANISADQFAFLWGKLCAAYPDYETSAAMMTVYYERLRGFKEHVLTIAVGDCIDELKFFPRVAQIIEQVKRERRRPKRAVETPPDPKEAKSVLQKLLAELERREAETKQLAAEQRERDRQERTKRIDAKKQLLNEQAQQLSSKGRGKKGSAKVQQINSREWVH